MGWKDFIDEAKVKKTNKDQAKIKSLIEMSDTLIISLSRIKIDEISSSMILSNYYEALRQVVEAIAISFGYKVYSHEAFTYFLLEILKENIISKKFDRFRWLRNGVNYYGKRVEIGIAREAKEDILNLIKKLIRKYLK